MVQRGETPEEPARTDSPTRDSALPRVAAFGPFRVRATARVLEKDGIAPEKFANVHAPVGLDIGALTPEEIAISITAELIAIRRGATNLSHKAVNHVSATPASVV